MLQFKNIISVCLVGAFLFLSASLCNAAAPEGAMTNRELVGTLIDVLGLEMPEGSQHLSDAELFEVQTNLLAANGVDVFVGASPDAAVTRGAVAEVLFTAISAGDPSSAQAVTTQDKIDFLASKNYLDAGKAEDVITANEVITSLNVPQVSSAVAETYTAPGERGTKVDSVGAEDTAAAATPPPPPPQASPAPERPASGY